MSVGKLSIVALSVMSLGTDLAAQSADPGEILKKVSETYSSLKTYKDEGTIVSDIDTGSMKMKIETSFSILLSRPNQYRIEWSQKNMPMGGMAQPGAVWNDGAQAYLFMGIANAYYKMGADEAALASATGISGGAAATIPLLFFPQSLGGSPGFARLKNAKFETAEKVGGEDCYVISATSAASSKETFWISKSKNLIVQYQRSLERGEGENVMPELTDRQIEDALKGMGQKVTEESRKNMKEMMSMAAAATKDMKLKGWSTETHVKISSPEVKKVDFSFVPPEGTALKDSMFGGGN